MATLVAIPALLQCCPLSMFVRKQQTKVIIPSKTVPDSVLGFAWEVTVTNRWVCWK